MRTNRWRRTQALVIALVAAGLALSGCAPKRHKPPVSSPDAFLERLEAACDPSTPVPLRSLTSVEWDRVWLFPEGTSEERFKALTGYDNPFGGVTPREAYLVLQNGGKIVDSFALLPAQVHGNRENFSLSYGADVLLRMTETPRGCFGELTPASEVDPGAR